jgi:hypothetical protein
VHCGSDDPRHGPLTCGLIDELLEEPVQPTQSVVPEPAAEHPTDSPSPPPALFGCRDDCPHRHTAERLEELVRSQEATITLLEADARVKASTLEELERQLSTCRRIFIQKLQQLENLEHTVRDKSARIAALEHHGLPLLSRTATKSTDACTETADSAVGPDDTRPPRSAEESCPTSTHEIPNTADGHSPASVNVTNPLPIPSEVQQPPPSESALVGLWKQRFSSDREPRSKSVLPFASSEPSRTSVPELDRTNRPRPPSSLSSVNTAKFLSRLASDVLFSLDYRHQ